MRKLPNIGKLINISENTTLALCLTSFCGLVFNLVFYEILRNKIINYRDILVISDKIGIYVAIIFIIFFFFHISAILSLILQLKFFKRESLLRSFSFFVSIISTLMIFGDFALLSDITKEYIHGFEEGIAGEFFILYLSQGLHLLFIILVIVLVILTKKEIHKKAAEEIVLKDESIFINANYIGVLCSISGLAILVLSSIFSPLWALRKGIMIITLMVVLPYIMIITYWLITKAREKVGEWYDEKQYQDITKASLITLVASVVLLAVIFALQYWWAEFSLLNVIWFPLYLFLILLLFSSITLYFSKKDTI
jgi:hypothetical protein